MTSPLPEAKRAKRKNVDANIADDVNGAKGVERLGQVVSAENMCNITWELP